MCAREQEVHQGKRKEEASQTERERLDLSLRKVLIKTSEYSLLPATFSQSGIPSVKPHQYLTTTHKQTAGLFFPLQWPHTTLTWSLPCSPGLPMDGAAHFHLKDEVQTVPPPQGKNIMQDKCRIWHFSKIYYIITIAAKRK